IAIVYPFYAHYRKPIIEELVKDSDYEFYFIAGKKTNPSFKSLKVYDFKGINDRFLEVRNIWFLNFFLLQVGLLKHLKSTNFDAVIFLEDWKYLTTWMVNSYLKIKRVPTYFWSHGLLNTKKTVNNILKTYFLKTFSHGGFL